jgi:hypothetical protein
MNVPLLPFATGTTDRESRSFSMASCDQLSALPLSDTCGISRGRRVTAFSTITWLDPCTGLSRSWRFPVITPGREARSGSSGFVGSSWWGGSSQRRADGSTIAVRLVVSGASPRVLAPSISNPTLAQHRDYRARK